MKFKSLAEMTDSNRLWASLGYFTNTGLFDSYYTELTPVCWFDIISLIRLFCRNKLMTSETNVQFSLYIG